MSIAQQLRQVTADIQEAAKQCGRPPESVRLVAVSKLHPVEAVQEAALAGQVDFGENHVQEMVAKQAVMPQLRWHMIGSLQRNKVKYIVPFVHLIHSVDSERLLEEIDRQAAKHGRVVACLLQINISHEPQKGGFSEEEAGHVLARIAQWPNVRIEGLMGMAEFTDDINVQRQQFRSLRLIAEHMRIHEGPQVAMRELSMGMSGDYPAAVAEGATLVRIGSSIFGSRYSH